MALEPQYKFAPKPDKELECVICLSIADDPYQHTERELKRGCGKLVCAQCLKRYGRDKPCPHCQTGSHFIRDSKSRIAIQELPVECNDPIENCGWKGTFGTRHTHIEKCLISCPNKCKGNKMKREDLDKHLKEDCRNRVYECRHCKLKKTYGFITGLHDNVCEFKIIPCPKTDCKETMQRKDVNRHVTKDCQYTAVSCKYVRLGCNMNMARKDIVAHEQDDKFHLDMAAENMNETKQQVKSMECKIKSLEKSMEHMESKIKYVIIGVVILAAFFGMMFIAFSTEDSLMSIENRLMRKITVKFYVPRLSDTVLYRPLYIAGYHVVVMVYANGYGAGEGTHVSVFVALKEGEYDDELKWPFIGNITVTLLNKCSTERSKTKTIAFTATDNMNPKRTMSRGWRKFIQHSLLDSCFVNNDELHFQASIVVAPLEISH